LAIPFHQFVKRGPAGAIKGNNFSVQDCIFHFKFPGHAGCQIAESPHFISAAGSEPVPAVANMCERPEAIVLLTHKTKQVAPANWNDRIDSGNTENFQNVTRWESNERIKSIFLRARTVALE